MHSFDIIQRKRNMEYYASGKNIYADFKTFGGSEKIAEANAIEFCKRFSEGRAYEFGVGNGLFAYYFLKKVNDLKPRMRVEYFICDISRVNLQTAKRRLRGFDVETVLCDAEGELDFMESPDYIRANELYDDLSSRIFVREGEEVFEVYFGEKLEKEYMGASGIEMEEFMQRMPDGYEIPVSFGASEHLNKCRGKLEKGGYIDIFDYGFSSVDEIKVMPKEMWNNSVVREFNGQLTVDVNFPWLGKNAGKTEPQKEYAERVLGKKLYYVELEQLYYFDEADVRKNRKKMEKFDYEEGFIFGGIDELDEYKHFMVEK